MRRRSASSRSSGRALEAAARGRGLPLNALVARDRRRRGSSAQAAAQPDLGDPPVAVRARAPARAAAARTADGEGVRAVVGRMRARNSAGSISSSSMIRSAAVGVANHVDPGVESPRPARPPAPPWRGRSRRAAARRPSRSRRGAAGPGNRRPWALDDGVAEARRRTASANIRPRSRSIGQERLDHHPLAATVGRDRVAGAQPVGAVAPPETGGLITSSVAAEAGRGPRPGRPRRSAVDRDVGTVGTPLSRKLGEIGLVAVPAQQGGRIDQRPGARLRRGRASASHSRDSRR